MSHQLPNGRFVIVVECMRLGPETWDVSYSPDRVAMHRGVYNLAHPSDLMLYSLDMRGVTGLTIWSCVQAPELPQESGLPQADVVQPLQPTDEF